MNGATYVRASKNAKTGPCDATYASLRACPTSCQLRDNGCYAQDGHVGITVRRLDSVAAGRSPEDIAQAEADAIDAAYNGRRVPPTDLRVHVSGDCATESAARLVSSAVGRWIDRGGGTAWSYTHAWREVPRRAWGKVFVLGSATDPSDIPDILAQGYAPALVVAERDRVTHHGIRFIPCPAQGDNGPTCVECRLCMDDVRLLAKNTGISFIAHGAQKKRVLKVLQEST